MKQIFFEADLHGARFAGALLEKANFASAKNLPDGIREKLDKDGFYTGKAPFQPPAQSAKAGPIRVFISKPGSLAYDQQQHLNAVQTRLEKEGFTMQTLERDDYPRFGSIGEIRRLISDCSGAMIFGFKQLEVRDGLWLSDFKKEKEVKDLCMSTPWNQIEAGMAATLGLPIFVVSQRGIAGGIFDESLVESESQIFRVFVEDSLNSTAYVKSFSEWCANVRERSLIN